MTTPDWQWFLDRGLRPFPVSGIRDGVCRCMSGKNCTSPGKHPKFKGWQSSAGTAQAMDRWSEGDNVGVATGHGLVVLDWDGRPTSSKSCATLKVSTPSGGEHWYFSTLRPVRNGVKVFDDILDIRGDGGFVVAPPSIHRSGGQYTWLGDVTRPTAPPKWVQNLLPPERKISREMMRWPLDDPETESIYRTDLFEEVLLTLRETPRGERNAALFRAACEVTELICSGGISRDRLTDVADVGVEIGLSPAEVKRTMASAVRTVATLAV